MVVEVLDLLLTNLERFDTVIISTGNNPTNSKENKTMEANRENNTKAQAIESRTVVVARPTVVFKTLRLFKDDNNNDTYTRVNENGTEYSVMEFLLKSFNIDESFSEAEQEKIKKDIRVLAPRSNPFSNSDITCRQISLKIYKGKESGQFFGTANELINMCKTKTEAPETTLEICYNLVKTERGERKTRLFVQFPYVERFTKTEATNDIIEEVKGFED